ncbi:MAG: hypothetical protein WCK34_00235 [Bacteroidota bacterium]
MKRYFLRFTIILSLLVIPALYSLADNPDSPPPDPGGDPTGGGTPVGAPIDNGTAILLVLGTCYGTWKLYNLRKQDPDKIRQGDDGV